MSRKAHIDTRPVLQIYALIFIIKFNTKTVFNMKCFCTTFEQGPVKHLKWSFLQRQLTAENVLTNFAIKGFIIDVCRGL